MFENLKVNEECYVKKSMEDKWELKYFIIYNSSNDTVICSDKSAGSENNSIDHYAFWTSTSIGIKN